MSEIGIVVIGRNEGQRLVHCVNRLLKLYQKIVYVDSGSTDGSVGFAQSIGIPTVELDTHMPFSAARARNEGFMHLLAHYPGVEYVQFIDGDCELDEDWPLFAQHHLEQNPSWAVVCGRRKERQPGKSIYNLLCDLEWDTLIGRAQSSGGDFMIKTSAFQEVNGFNASVIAGEEPELGFRLREKGWQIWRLNHPMTLHDADMIRFSQWWKRMERTGYAYAQGLALHFNSKEKYCMRETMSIWLWAAVIPIFILTSGFVMHPAFYLCFLIYPIQFLRIMTRQYQKKSDWSSSFCYALFTLIGKLPELIGQIQFWIRMTMNKKNKLIEYKSLGNKS